MATMTTLWLMPIMMAGSCFSYEGPPVSPSPPGCHIPCDDSGCSSDIICTWDPVPGPNNLTYTLHWEGSQSKATGYRAIIQRHHFTSHSELKVWVQTKDKDGTVSKSETVTFNTADIIKPSPPEIISSSHEPMEIHWLPPCDQLMLEVGHCDVRHCTETQPAWVQQEEGGVSGSYTLNSPEPGTKYSFQVRCACGKSMMSEWSEVLTIKSAERAPLGMLDVWRDCGMLPQSSECVLTWKKLPMSKARGHILGYNWRLYFNNGTDVALNESVAASLRLVCSEVQCYYNSPLKDVKSVSISTYNALGVTPPSHLDIQVPVKIPKEVAIHLEMNESILIVSWNITPWVPDIKGYVVQYKEAGSSLGQGLDWIRLNASLTKVIMKGQFKKFTAYQVSVFTVLDHSKVHLYCTDVTHFVQGTPAKVPLFKVLSYGTTHVTLLWETVLMSVQNGVTPYYQVGYDKDNVKNVSAHPQLENRTITLDDLKENHDYEVWIKAVNQAGPGPNNTVVFKTLSSENIGVITKFLVGVGVTFLIVLLFTLFCCRDNKACPAVLSSLYEKVPDPHNSNIIREMKYQINDSLAWLCVPAVEQCPKISEIEIVKTSSFAFIPQTDKLIDDKDGDDPLEDILTEERKKIHSGCGKQEYSKMVDSDDEKNEEDETSKSSCCSEEDNVGYEQHFLPTDLDIQEIEERERTEKRCGESQTDISVLC